MKISRIVALNYYAYRSISFTHVNSKNDVRGSAKFLKKLLDNDLSKRQQTIIRKTDVNYAPIIPSINTQAMGSYHTLKRMKIHNKLLMKYIAQLMETGKTSADLLARNVEIIDVKVTAKFDRIDVIWIDNCDSEKTYDIPTEVLLQGQAGDLRYELSKLQVLAQVPPIYFIKSKHILLMRKVEERLKLIDAENILLEKSKEQSVLTSSSLSEANSDAAKNITETSFNITLPVMHQNVFGLDHYHIMSKIKNKIKKSKVHVEAQKSIISSDINISPPSQVKNSKMVINSAHILSEFLLKRRNEKRYKYSKRKLKRDEEMILGANMEETDSYDSQYENDYNADDDFENLQHDDDHKPDK